MGALPIRPPVCSGANGSRACPRTPRSKACSSPSLEFRANSRQGETLHQLKRDQTMQEQAKPVVGRNQTKLVNAMLESLETQRNEALTKIVKMEAETKVDMEVLAAEIGRLGKANQAMSVELTELRK